MTRGPSKAAEAIVAVFVPPACREEVLGDLHERYRSPLPYAWEAFCTVPLVIASRIRRTTDPQVLLMQAFALYISFLGAAWFQDPALLRGQWGLMRLAVPAGMGLVGLVLEDAYAKPGWRSPLRLVRGPVIGLGLALLSQGMFRAGKTDLALPPWILFFGCAMSLLLTSAIRMLFPPGMDQLQGAHVPADWLERGGRPAGTSRNLIPGVRNIAAIVGAAVLLMFIAYRLWTRG